MLSVGVLMPIETASDNAFYYSFAVGATLLLTALVIEQWWR